MKIGHHRYKLNSDLSETSQFFILIVGLVVVIIAVFFSIGYIAVQFLGITPAIASSGVFNYYMNVGASGFMIALFSSISLFMLYYGGRKIIKKPSILYSWLITREAIPNEDYIP